MESGSKPHLVNVTKIRCSRGRCIQVVKHINDDIYSNYPKKLIFEEADFYKNGRNTIESHQLQFVCSLVIFSSLESVRKTRVRIVSNHGKAAESDLELICCENVTNSHNFVSQKLFILVVVCLIGSGRASPVSKREVYPAAGPVTHYEDTIKPFAEYGSCENC